MFAGGLALEPLHISRRLALLSHSPAGEEKLVPKRVIIWPCRKLRRARESQLTGEAMRGLVSSGLKVRVS